MDPTRQPLGPVTMTSQYRAIPDIHPPARIPWFQKYLGVDSQGSEILYMCMFVNNVQPGSLAFLKHSNLQPHPSDWFWNPSYI